MEFQVWKSDSSSHNAYYSSTSYACQTSRAIVWILRPPVRFQYLAGADQRELDLGSLRNCEWSNGKSPVYICVVCVVCVVHDFPQLTSEKACFNVLNFCQEIMYRST
jgi:hypothetical protein